jgi:hypothetical protein
MNLVGLMPCRNEDWVLGLSARVALMWVDRLVIADHGSTDGSRAIMNWLAEEFPGRVTIRDDRAPEWREMEQREMLLAETRELGASHVAIIDCDELLTANLLGGIREHIANLPRGSMLSLPGYNLRGGLTKYHANGVWGHRWFSTAFRDESSARWRGDKYHSREPEGVAWKQYKPVSQAGGGILHLWGANERRLIAKHALYKIRDTLRWPDQLETYEREYSWAIKGDTKPPYVHFGTPATWTYYDVQPAWIAPYADLICDHLHVTAEPWQEAEVRRQVAKHGRQRFEGLDLFGLA